MLFHRKGSKKKKPSKGEAFPASRGDTGFKKEMWRNDEAQRIAHFGYWEWHIASGKIIWSDEIYRIYGLSKEDFTLDLDNIFDHIHERDRDMCMEILNNTMENHKPGWFEIRIIRPTGEIRWYESSVKPFYDEKGNIDYILGTGHDITERKRAENLAAERERHLRVTLNSIGDGVISTDVNGVITDLNPVAEALTGWNRSEASGKELNRVFTIFNSEKDNKPVDPSQTVLSGGKPVRFARGMTLKKREEGTLKIACNAAPIFDDENILIGTVLVFRDISEEISLQEKLQQSQKLEAIGQLAGGIAHDFNNVLGGIIGAADILAAHVGDKGIVKNISN